LTNSDEEQQPTSVFKDKNINKNQPKEENFLNSTIDSSQNPNALPNNAIIDRSILSTASSGGENSGNSTCSMNTKVSKVKDIGETVCCKL